MSKTTGLEVLAEHRRAIEAMETLLATVFEGHVSPDIELRCKEGAALDFYEGVQDYALINSDVFVTFGRGDSTENLISELKGADFLYADTSLGEGHIGFFGVFDGVTFYVWHHGMCQPDLGEGEPHPLIAEHGLTAGTTTRLRLEDDDDN